MKMMYNPASAFFIACECMQNVLAGVERQKMPSYIICFPLIFLALTCKCWSSEVKNTNLCIIYLQNAICATLLLHTLHLPGHYLSITHTICFVSVVLVCDYSTASPKLHRLYSSYTSVFTVSVSYTGKFINMYKSFYTHLTLWTNIPLSSFFFFKFLFLLFMFLICLLFFSLSQTMSHPTTTSL